MNWRRPLGDTGPALAYTIRHEPTLGQRAGTPRDLTGVTSVVGTVRRWSDRAIVQSAAATVGANSPELIDELSFRGLPTSLACTVELPLTTMISTSPGLHAVSFVVTATDQRTYPADPMHPAWLLLAAPLAGGAAVALPDPGAPLFIADGATGAVTANGQMVFAGASSTVTMPASVSWIQLGQNGTPWAPGTTPTLVQAGSTVHAGAAAALLASGGNLVVITSAGSVLTATATGRAPIWAYTGANYAPDPDARLIQVGTGDPAPTGLADNDITLTINP